MNIVKSIALSTVAILAITSCGSSDSSDPVVVPQDQTINGAAVDGYLNGATVCLDLNNDGMCAIGTEPATSTAVDGSYSLTLTPAEQVAAANSVSLLVYGGIDMDTGEWFSGRLRAPLGSGVINITPLTTMVQSVVANGGSVEAAEQQVADALGLNVDQVNADPVELYATAPEVMEATLTVQRIVEVLASAAIAAGNTDGEAAVIETIYEDLAAAVVTVAEDTTTSGMAAIVTEAAVTSESIDAGVAEVAAVIEQEIAEVIAANSDLSDAALLIDASAEAVEEAVVSAVEGDDTSTLVDDAQAAADNAETDVEWLAIENLFQAYEVAVTDEQITEIASALTADVTVSAVIALDLSASTIATPAVITALVGAYDAQQLEQARAEVEMYLADLGVTSQIDATLEEIAGLTGFSNTMSETDFVALLRTSTDVNLLAIADQLDPPAPIVDDTNWNNISSFYFFQEDHDGDRTFLKKEEITLNGGTLNFTELVYDVDASAWVTPPWDQGGDSDDYKLVDGVWVLDSDNSEAYTISADGSILTVESSFEVKVDSAQDLSGQTITISPTYGIDVTFSAGAKRYILASRDIVEIYESWWAPTIWDQNGDTGTNYTTLAGFFDSGQGCLYYRESDQTCANFSQDDQLTDGSGELVTIDWNNGGAETVVGTWILGDLPGQIGDATILTTINDTSFIEENEDMKFATVINNIVYIGAHFPAQTEFSSDPEEIAGNLQAMQDIAAAVEAHIFTPAVEFTTAFLSSQPLYDVYYENGTAYVEQLDFTIEGNITLTGLEGSTSVDHGTYNDNGDTTTVTITNSADTSNPYTLILGSATETYIEYTIDGVSGRLYYDQSTASAYAATL